MSGKPLWLRNILAREQRMVSKTRRELAPLFTRAQALADVYEIVASGMQTPPNETGRAQPVVPLPCHEIENLFCLRGIFVAVAKHLGSDTSAADEAYSQFLSRGSGVFKAGAFNKQVSERFRRRLEHAVLGELNTLKVDEDLAEMERTHGGAFDSKIWSSRTGELFREVRVALEDALANPGEEFVQVFPGKVLLSHAADALGMKSEALVELVCNALAAGPGTPLASLGTECAEVLAPLLPPRSSQVATG